MANLYNKKLVISRVRNLLIFSVNLAYLDLLRNGGMVVAQTVSFKNTYQDFVICDCNLDTAAVCIFKEITKFAIIPLFLRYHF